MSSVEPTLRGSEWTLGALARFSYTASRREAGEARGYKARAAWRAEAYLSSTVSTTSKRNEVDMGLSRLVADGL